MNSRNRLHGQRNGAAAGIEPGIHARALGTEQRIKYTNIKYSVHDSLDWKVQIRPPTIAGHSAVFADTPVRNDAANNQMHVDQAPGTAQDQPPLSIWSTVWRVMAQISHWPDNRRALQKANELNTRNEQCPEFVLPTQLTKSGGQSEQSSLLKLQEDAALRGLRRFRDEFGKTREVYGHVRSGSWEALKRWYLNFTSLPIRRCAACSPH